MWLAVEGRSRSFQRLLGGREGAGQGVRGECAWGRRADGSGTAPPLLGGWNIGTKPLEDEAWIDFWADPRHFEP